MVGSGGKTMNVQARILGSAVVGALVGGVAAYLVFTTRGRDAFAQVNPTLDDLSHQLREFRLALRRARGVAHEVRRAAVDVQTVLAGGDLEPDV
jgi:hypothetical protein